MNKTRAYLGFLFAAIAIFIGIVFIVNPSERMKDWPSYAPYLVGFIAIMYGVFRAYLSMNYFRKDKQ